NDTAADKEWPTGFPCSLDGFGRVVRNIVVSRLHLGLTIKAVPMLPQTVMLIDMQDFPKEQKIPPLRYVNALPPVPQVLHCRIERGLRLVSARGAKLLGQSQIVHMPLLDA